jgi:TP901 family phage tail tape measure protein
MDSILNEMGAKWESLSKDQQVALAQTVAGVRQYNQLVSLMDNWDFMQENVELSLNSDGTLQEQAEIYEESWKAASDRVRAALEGIYSTLLDDEFFIDLTDALSVFLEGMEGFFEGMGGMEGVLGTIGAFISQKLAKEAPAALNRIH